MTAAIHIKADRIKAIKRKHPWIFSKAIKKVVGDPKVGETIDVLTPDGQWLAKAAYSPHSQIRARVWSKLTSTKISLLPKYKEQKLYVSQ